MAGKDLLVERRSRVATNQIAPFALLVLFLFAFALEPDRGVLAQAAAGLFWLAVVLCALLAVQRSFSIEASDAARDGLRLSGLDPAAIFLGKAGAVAVQLLALEALLGVGVVVLYDVEVRTAWLLALTCLAATAGLASAGTLYGALAAGTRARETLLPVLLLPILAPVVLSAARATEAALGGTTADGWPWLRLLAAFAAVYAAVGTVAFGPLLEES